MSTKNISITKGGNKKKKAFVLVLLLLFLFFLSSCGTRNVVINNNLDVKAEIGYDKTVSINPGNPVTFSITNGGKDFSGEIRIRIPSNYKEDRLLIIPIEIAGNSQKTIEEFIPIITVKKVCTYEIVSNNNIVKTGTLVANKFLDPKISRVAIAADHPDEYGFLTSTHFNKSFEDFQAYDREASASSESLVENEANQDSKNFTYGFKNLESFSNKNALAFFDFIFIGDISDLKLSEEGLKNLENWVKSGGVLIVETGENYEKMNKVIPDSLKAVNFNGLEGMPLEHNELKGTLTIAKGDKTRESVSEIAFLKKTPDGQTPFIKSIVGYKENLGSGSIFTVNTLLNKGDAKELNRNGNYFQVILSTANLLSQRNFAKGSYNEPNMLDRIPRDSSLPFGLIGVILFVYSMIAIPLLYFILKKKDKRNLMWILGPCMAILVILGISQIGRVVWGNKAIVNEISIISYEEGRDSLKAQSYLALFNNTKDDLKISWDKEDALQIQGLDDRYMDEQVPDENRRISSAMYLQQDPLFYSYDTHLWDYIRATGEKSLAVKDQGSGISMNTIEGKQSFKIKNGLPMDLENAILCWNQTYYSIGTLASGEEINVELSKLKRFNNLHNNVGLDEYYGNIYSVIEDSFQNPMNDKNTFSNPIVIGLTKEPVGYKIKINDGEPKTFARNIVFLKLHLSIEEDSEVFFNEDNLASNTYGVLTDRQNPLNTDNTVAITLDSYKDRNVTNVQMDGKANSLVTDFFLPQKVQVESMAINFNTNKNNTLNSFDDSKQDSYSGTEPLRDRFFILNVQSNQYDEIFLENMDLFQYENMEYLEENNKVEDSKKNREKQALKLEEIENTMDEFLAEKLYKVDKEKYLSSEGQVKIKILKPKLFENKWYDLKAPEIEVKGVYHD